MSKWANQCKRSFQENENEADDVQKWQRTWLEMRWKHFRTEYSRPNRCKKVVFHMFRLWYVPTGSVKPMSKSATAKLICKLIRSRGTQRQFSENICSEGDLRSRIFWTFVVKFLVCLPLLGFSNIYKMVQLPIFNGFYPKKGHLGFSGAFSWLKFNFWKGKFWSL